MSACLKQRDIEEFISGTLSARRTAAVRRHVAECEQCARAVGEAQANQEWLAKLRDGDELGDLRRRIADGAAAQTAPGLTTPPSKG